VPRVVSFIVLVAILLLMGAVFFRVIAQFVVPLFLAAVLVVIFKPLFERIRRRVPNNPHIAALATTLLILLVALLPTVWLGWNSYVECRHVFNTYFRTEAQRSELQQRLMAKLQPTLDYLDRFTSSRNAAVTHNGEDTPEAPAGKTPTDAVAAPASSPKSKSPIPTLSTDLGNRLASFIGGTLLSTVQAVASLAIGLAIMTIALFYFFLDGPSMIAAIMRMSPIDDAYERQLLDKFATVSRAVVVASLASAVAQGLLAGIGYYFALNAGAPIFLLTMVTILFGIVPFVGAAAVWVPTALWIYMFQTVAGSDTPGDTVSAIALAIYGTVVVSGIDNVIKPMVLHGQSNLHPLLALISVLGGVQVLGPIGILVGPMLVAFFQALVEMVNKELVLMGDKHRAPASGRRQVLAAGSAPTLVEEITAAVSGEGASPAAKPTSKPAPAKPAKKPRQRRKRSN